MQLNLLSLNLLDRRCRTARISRLPEAEVQSAADAVREHRQLSMLAGLTGRKKVDRLKRMLLEDGLKQEA